jgi:integrase
METQSRQKYTEAMIKRLPKKNQKYYALDSEVIGLRIYVQISGEKSFYLQRYLKEFKYSKKTKIGDFPEMSIKAARKLAAEIKSDNVQGKDPIVAAAARAKEKTFEIVLNEYVEKRLKNRTDKNKLKNEQSNIDCWLLGNTNDVEILKLWKLHREDLNIKSKRMSSITKEDIIDYHKAVTVKTSYHANQMVKFIRKLFNYAKGRRYFTGDNPASMFKGNYNAEIKDHSDYYGSADMHKIILAALKLSKKHEKRVACYGILASLLCGGRPQSEIFNLTVDQIDIKNKCIHYRKSKVGQWTRPINPRMIAHLELIMKARSDADPVLYYPTGDLRNKYLFPNCRYGELRRGKRGLRPCKLLHINEVRKTWKLIKDAAGVNNRDLKSLRHTFAVFCVSSGVSLRVLQKYMGHKRIETTMIYAAATDDFVDAESDKLAKGYAA